MISVVLLSIVIVITIISGTRTSSSQSKSKFSTHSARSSPSNRSGKTAEIIDPVGKIFSLDGEKPFQDPLSKEFNKLMRMQVNVYDYHDKSFNIDSFHIIFNSRRQNSPKNHSCRLY